MYGLKAESRSIWQLVFYQVESVFSQLGWATSPALVRYYFANEDILDPVLVFLHLRVVTSNKPIM